MFAVTAQSFSSDDPLSGLVSDPRLQTWTTVFVSVLVQAVPFLVFGVVLSAVIAVFVPRSFWAKALPRHPAAAVPAASLAGVVLPGCECGTRIDGPIWSSSRTIARIVNSS